jgi:hypothetical protein
MGCSDYQPHLSLLKYQAQLPHKAVANRSTVHALIVLICVHVKFKVKVLCPHERLSFV